VFRQCGKQVVEAQRFHEKRGSAKRRRFGFGVCLACQKDNRDSGRRGVRFNCVEEFNPAHIRQFRIGQEKIGTAFEQKMAGDYRVLCEQNLVTSGAQVQAQKLAHMLVTIYNQDRRRQWLPSPRFSR
jgi:hypothetical protein